VLAKRSDLALSWILDTNTARAEDVARAYGIERTADSLEAAPDVKAVLVATPPGSRREIYEVAAHRGWHAFCEKPFAFTLTDHQQFMELARRNGLALAVGFLRRFYESTKRARDIVKAGMLGPVQSILAGEGTRARKFGRGGDWYQGSAKASGGVLFETGSHLVDQVFSICGVTAFDIKRCRQELSNGLEFETRALATVTLGDGSNVPCSIAVSRLSDVYNGIVIRCRNGEIRLDLAPDSPVRLHAMNGTELARFGAGDRSSVYTAIAGEWDEFLARCTRPEALGDTGLLTTSFLEACGRRARDKADHEVECAS
jgi:predicted dehydrogenase